MDDRQISSQEYTELFIKLDRRALDGAAGIRSQLAEKYYAYLDKLMQLKMAIRDYEQVVAEARTALKDKF